MYFIGGLPLLLFFVLRRVVPESPRWLADQSRFAQADTALKAFESSVRGPLPAAGNGDHYDQAASAHPKRRKLDVISPAYLKRTIAIACLWGTCGVIQYGLGTWMPTIYRTIYHASLQMALNLTVAASVLIVIGSLVCALLVDKVGRKPIISIAFVMCAISLGLAGLLHDASLNVVAVLCALGMGFMGCGFITAYVYTPELYPTSIRAFGCGLGSSWLKIAAIFAPGMVAASIHTGNLNTAFYCLAAAPLIAAAAIHFLSIETKETVLEDLEA
jgi:MFS family permease